MPAMPQGLAKPYALIAQIETSFAWEFPQASFVFWWQWAACPKSGGLGIRPSPMHFSGPGG